MEGHPKNKYLIGVIGLIAVIIIALVASGAPVKFFKGEFDFESRDFQRDIDIPLGLEDLRNDRLDNVAQMRDTDADWQRKISDNPYPPTDLITSSAEDDAKKEEEKQKAEAEKLESLSKTILSVSPSKVMLSTAEATTSSITPQQSLSANQYTLCASGPSDVTIGNVKFMSQGSDHSSVGLLQITGKPDSLNVAIHQDWSGDFMTIDNYLLLANSCVEVGMRLTSVDAKAEWQRISLVGVKANVKVQYNNQANDWLGNNNETLIVGTHIAFKPDKKIFITNVDKPKNKTYKANATGSDFLYGSYAIYTPNTGKASVSSVKLSLVTKDYESMTFKIKASTPKPYLWYTNNLGSYAWDSDTSSSGTPAPADQSITMKAGEEITIPLNVNLSYGQVTVLKILSVGSTPATKGNFYFKVVDVVTDGSLDTNLATLDTTIISIVDNLTAAAFIYPHPSKGSKQWIDSTDAQNSINKEGSYKIAYIKTSVSGTDSNNIIVKDLSIKFDGTFKEPLKLKFFNNNVLIATELVSKGDVVTLSDFFLLDLYIKAENIPGDPKFIHHIKPKITNLVQVFNTDIDGYKKGQSIPQFIQEWDFDKEMWVNKSAIFPFSFGIVSIGPTTLNFIDIGGSGGSGASKLVTIANLPKGKTSGFTMNTAYFLAQGDVKIHGVTYKHLARDTSPFKDIKLQRSDANVYLKSADWTKENSIFTPSTPFIHGNEETWSYELVALDPAEPVEDIWFDLIQIDAKTPGGTLVPVFVKSLPLGQNPVKGPVYIFK